MINNYTKSKNYLNNIVALTELGTMQFRQDRPTLRRYKQ